MRVRPLLLALGITLASLNVWTGAPLAALWLGSRVQGEQGGASMTAVFVVLVVMGALAIGLVQVVGRLSAGLDRELGRRRRRRTTTWLKPMAAERRTFEERRAEVGPAERILVGVVAAAVLVFEVWFFFFSGSSIGSA